MRRAHAPTRSLSTRSFLALAALAALPACDGCHGNKPYTPYTLSDSPDGSASAAATQSAAPPADAAAPAFTAIPATPAPNEGKSWPLEGGAAEPPAGHTFAQGLVFDADGDGKPDLFAWSRAADNVRGEIYFASGKAPAEGRPVIALPADLASPGCNPSASLTRIGGAMVAFDFDPRCPRAREKSARWIAAFRARNSAPPELALELRVAPSAEGETLTITLDGRDRDSDGRGDLTATFTLTGAPKPLPGGATAQATLAYLDRPAGLSRDPSEPEASLKAIAASLITDGRKKTTAPRIAAAAVTARRLLTLLCEDAGKPAITTTAGPIRCGETRLLEDSVIAEIEAHLNLGDPLAAIAAFSRLEAKRRDVDALIAKTIPTITGKLVRTTAATPLIEPSPSFGPIAFNTAGDLLIRTRDRTLRVDRTSFEETPVDAALQWPKRLTFSTTDAPVWTLTSIDERCDSPTLMAHFEAAAAPIDLPLPIPTAPRCAPGHPQTTLLGPSPSGDLLAVRGEILTISRDPTPRVTLSDQLSATPPIPLGASRSPDGNAIAIPTPRAVAVALLKSPRAAVRLWTSPLTDNATACVPNNTADRLACAVKDAVAIYDAQ